MLSAARRIYQAEPPRHRQTQFFPRLKALQCNGLTRHRMRKKGLTEREIIDFFKRRFDFGPPLPLGFDEDVAALPMSDRRLVVVKTDMLVGSTDIPPGMTLNQAARKAVVATVSDFAAKGVQPKALLVSLGLIPPVTRGTVREIARGLSNGALEYGCRIIGGDTGQSDDLVIDCIGIGFGERGAILPRDGARPGDIVAVTGPFGKTNAGLRILLSKKLRTRRFSGLVSSILHPVARLRVGLELARTGAVSSSIDSSDGLAWSLHEIARLSHVKIVLDKIPVAPDVEGFAREHRLSREDLALFGGEEYELVMTIKRASFASVRSRVPSLLKIGHVERGRGEVVAEFEGRIRSIEPRGYEHFR
ncbi:thiamine-phosphate kinase [Candidatus Bathyarchaeota archaeon]|nr:MAG: thiamine-phosphate kinase [Candidatus Bathyarchaeota archaeon]